MRRPGRFFGWLTTALLLGWGLSWVVPRVPGALAEMDWFRVRGVRVEGVRYLTAGEVESAAAVPPDANLWDDPRLVAARVRAHPLVRDARVRRRIPGTLVVRVEEREPVGLVPTPTLAPVDREGRLLPLDPVRHRLDLPVIRPERSGRGAPEPAAIAAAARAASRLSELDPAFWSQVSVVTADGSRAVVVEWGDPAVRLRFRTPIAAVRLREAMAVLDDARAAAADTAAGPTGGQPPTTLDLRFADQVVVRRSGP